MRNTLLMAAILVTSLNAALLCADDDKKTSADPSGSWRWEQDYGDGVTEHWLFLRQQGDKLTGRYAGVSGDIELQDGQVKKGKFSFRLSADGEFAVHVMGSVSDDVLSGTTEITAGGESNTIPLKAARATRPEDVVGDWNLELEMLGQYLTPVFKVTRQADQLKVTAETGHIDDVDATEVTLKENKLSIRFEFESPGGPVDATYVGIPRGDTFNGVGRFDVGGQVGTTEFTGKRAVAR